MAHFLFDHFRGVEGGGEFGAELLAEALTQSVDGDFHGGVAETEGGGGGGLRRVGIAGEPGFQSLEGFGFSIGGELILKRIECAAEKC